VPDLLGGGTPDAPDETDLPVVTVSGTATGVVNFLNFTFSALLGPVFATALFKAADGAETMELAHYQTAFTPMLFGVALAMGLALLLKETGPAARAASSENTAS